MLARITVLQLECCAGQGEVPQRLGERTMRRVIVIYEACTIYNIPVTDPQNCKLPSALIQKHSCEIDE